MNENRCSVCGEIMLIGQPFAQGNSRYFAQCPYLSKAWHQEAMADINKQDQSLHLQERRKDQDFAHGLTGHPPDQGKRDIKQPRHDLIPIEFLDELASICEEGLLKYGKDNWKKGGKDFLTDCLNHASNHLHLYMNGDFSENQLAKVAWNCLAVRWHELKKVPELTL